jgi:mono/diheme cytochrome c family protein
MYAETREQLEEFIRFGAPRAWLENATALERLQNQHLRMPAYGTSLSDAQIENLVAFVAAVERVELPGDTQAAAGRTVAWEQGCPICHGVEASGGLANPGSLGGFIPGFQGGNFTDMVRDEEEFREWVLDGSSSRLERNPLVRLFWRRQKIQMPAYRDLLSDRELEQLWQWTLAVRRSSNSAPRSP